MNSNFIPQAEKTKRFLILVRKSYGNNWEVFVVGQSYHGSVSEEEKDLIVETLKFANVYDVKVVQV